MEGVTRITIWRAEKYRHPGEYSAVPGQILYQYEDDLLIACRSGVINLTGISLEGAEEGLAKKRSVAVFAVDCFKLKSVYFMD